MNDQENQLYRWLVLNYNYDINSYYTKITRNVVHNVKTDDQKLLDSTTCVLKMSGIDKSDYDHKSTSNLIQ